MRTSQASDHTRHGGGVSTTEREELVEAAADLSEWLRKIYQSTPPVDKDEQLDPTSYTEFVLQAAGIPDWHRSREEKWPRAEDVYDRLRVSAQIENIGATNIKSSFVLDIEPAQSRKTSAGWTSSRTSYEPHPTLKGVWKKAARLGLDLPAKLARLTGEAADEEFDVEDAALGWGEVDVDEEGLRDAILSNLVDGLFFDTNHPTTEAQGTHIEGPEPTETREQGRNREEGKSRRTARTDENPSNGTNGFGDCPSDTPENRRSERSDGESEVDAFFANPPVEKRCNRDQWARLVTWTKSIQEQLLVRALIEASHVATYNSGEEEDGRWVVMHNEKLHDRFGVSYPTRTVWEDSELIEARNGGAYVSPQEASSKGTNSAARELRVKREFLDEWARLGAEGGSYRYKAHRRELVRTHQPEPMSTDFYDENRHEYPDLITEALEVLEEANHKIILDAIEEAEEAIAGRDGAGARDELTSLRVAKETVKRQVIQCQDGVAQLQNAYEVQDLSGRIGFKRGGPLGLMGEVKQRGYDIEGYTNYDIKSCHTAALAQVAEMLAEVGVGVDVSAWKEYPGKYEVAASTGLPVSLVKVVEHAVKYGAVLPASLDQADYFESHSGHYPAAAKEVKKHAAEGLIDDPDAALQALRSVFSEMREVVVRVADALLGSYYDAKNKGGYLHNACGISFNPRDYDEGHERRSKAMAWMLQGLETAFVAAITVLSKDYDYDVVASEYDGAVVDGEVPDEAIEDAREMSGFNLAEFVPKPFADEEEVAEVYGGNEEEEPEEKEQQHTEETRTAPDRNSREEDCRRTYNPAGFPMTRGDPDDGPSKKEQKAAPV